MDIGTIFYSVFALIFIGYSLLFTMRTFAVSIAESNLDSSEEWARKEKEEAGGQGTQML